jgi:hypothetical protein
LDGFNCNFSPVLHSWKIASDKGFVQDKGYAVGKAQEICDVS